MGNKHGHPSKEIGNNNGYFPVKHKFNIKLFGDSCTGKTFLFGVYENGVYKEKSYWTDRFWVYRKELTVHNLATNVLIWDHPGVEQFPFLWSYCIPGSDGIFLLYDVTNIQTFRNLPEWLKTVRSLNPGAIIFIIGAKSDLFDEKEISHETGLKFARSENLEFFECSAKTGENVNYVFEHMVFRILQKEGVIHFDKIEIEGKSHEYKETKETFHAVVSEEEILYASITEKNLSSSITQKEIVKIEQKITPVEDPPKFLKEGKLLSEMETDCLGLKKVDDTDITKRNDYSSAQSDKDTSSELNEDCISVDNTKTVLPKTKKLELSEEEIQLEGRCPSWFA